MKNIPNELNIHKKSKTKEEEEKNENRSPREKFRGKTQMNVIQYGRENNFRIFREYHRIALERSALARKWDIATRINKLRITKQ